MYTRIRTRATLAAATTLAVAAGLTTALAAPALADETPAADEVVIPDAGRAKPREETLLQAGATGYVHRQEGTDGLLWTDTASGASTTLPTTAQSGHSGLYITTGGGAVTVTDIAKQTTTTIAIPAGRGWYGVYNADGIVTSTAQADGTSVALTLVRSVDGGIVETPVTGVPQGTGTLSRVGQDDRGAVLRASLGGDLFYLHYATGTLTPLPAAFRNATTVRLAPDHVLAWSTGSGTLYTVPRTDASAQPVTTVVPAPVDSLGKVEFSVLGTHVLFVRPAPSYDQRGVLAQKLQTVPLGGGATTDLLPAATANLTVSPDGGVLAVGGTSASGWAVHRITLGEDGTPRAATVQSVPRVPGTRNGLALGGGRLSYFADSVVGSSPALFDVDTSATGTPSAGEPHRRNRPLWDKPSGLRSLGDGESAFGNGAWVDATPNRTAELPSAGTVVDAAGRFALAKNGDTTYAVDLDLDYALEPDVRLTLHKSAAALWGTKVWKPAPSTGSVNSYDLLSGATSPAVNLGSGCVPSELQAVGRWLYWACGTAKAGIYDLTAKRSVAVPAGESLLGDGFVVRHDRTANKLLLTNAVTGLTTDFAAVPAWAAADGRGSTWTVDKFGANVAFVDAQKNIHVKRVPVAAQPFTLLDQDLRQISGGTSQLRWRMSRSVGAWSVEIKNPAGKTVRTYRGTTGNGAGVAVDWDSRDDLGRGVEDGTYTYVMNAQPANGVGAGLRRTGTVWAFDVGLTTLPGTYTPVTPARLMDTRSGLGVPKAKVGAGKTVSLKVTGTGGVPAAGVTAVVLNVTATNATSSSHVSVYPSGTGQTSASNLNFTAGRTAANLVTVPVVDGRVKFYNRAGSVDLLADVAGYYTAGTAGSAYTPVTPKRLMDTRNGTGVPKAKLAANGTVTLPVTEPGATAVVLNVTATNPTAGSFVSVYPHGTQRTSASNLNFTAGQTVPNLVVVPVKDGKVTFYNKNGTVDLLADVAGYFKKDTGSVFTGMQPKRLMDTRNGTGVAKGKVGAGKTVSLDVDPKYTAVVLNVTATNPTAGGFVSVYPYGTTRTAASNLNFTAGQTIPNLVVVPVKEGKVTFYNHSGTVDLLADIAGYYTAR
ncbi:FlgD immunoglobulin-like domain containing protein [Streptomyces showdoensis]|uniref:FlgD immunoglobulin-like domain containing protein n=1 Tax=Streptomyces showdoensis TaxID=68268 RepID=UPI000F4EBBEB|nr:FlgD immunoglobulin-like domain containing protein [Streptomyces showdoensis]